MILFDTSVFVAYLNERDKNHKRADELFTELLLGKYGSRFTISEVFSETATLLFNKLKRMDIVTKAWNLMYSKEEALVQPLIIKREDIDRAWELFQKYTTQNRPLSFVDCLLLSICQTYEMDSIVSFDSEFDGIIKRIY